MVTAKDGNIGPARVVIRSKETFNGPILAECNQIIREPVNLEDLLGCLGEQQEISRILLTNLPVSLGNVDQIIGFLQDIKSRLI